MITLTTHNLTKRFGKKAVFADVNIQFQGAVLGIGGPNGSGKSTLMKCLAGLLRPSAGSVTWNFRKREHQGPLPRKEMGYAAPYINHYSELTVMENLNFINRLRSLEKKSQDIEELLHILNIHTHKNIPYGLLSSGQQQRVKLGAALLEEPGVLFLDEPGTNLDKKGSEIIEYLIRDYVKKNGSVILASNNEDELRLCEQTLFLDP